MTIPFDSYIKLLEVIKLGRTEIRMYAISMYSYIACKNKRHDCLVVSGVNLVKITFPYQYETITPDP